MAEDNGEKTEEATPRRQEEARQEGNIARSPDLAAAATLLAGLLALNALGTRMFTSLRSAIETLLSPAWTPNPTRTDDLPTFWSYIGWMFATNAAPIILCVATIALLVAMSQAGLIFTAAPLTPNFAKLNPLRGLQNLLSTRTAFRTGMNLAKTILIATVAVSIILSDLPRVMLLAELDVLPMFKIACEMIYDLAVRLALLLLLLAVADYFYQRWARSRDLRMSKQEVKEEMKRMEGDPKMKQRRMKVARQLVLQRLGQSVPKADVVVTNPTHFAVAMKYDAKTMRAPRVVAKGADILAMRIRQLAVSNGIPIVERKEVARALYKTVDVGQEVPPDLYNAVAEIMAYVYRLSGRKIA